MKRELRPKGRLADTPFNAISVALLATAAVILFIRFTRGLGAVTNLNQDFAWGIWIGFDVSAASRSPAAPTWCASSSTSCGSSSTTRSCA